MYPRLEILVSDNCSPGSAVKNVVRQFSAADERIRYIRQPENLGSARNFMFLLSGASGDYFMWAADDDRWEPFFVADLVNELERRGKGYVCAAMEAQYVSGAEKLPFFPEGVPFYEFESPDPYERVTHLLRYAYGNLVYGLFRAPDLQRQSLGFFTNEIPFLVQVAAAGNITVQPRIGLYKSTIPPTYRQARWERQGGKLPDSEDFVAHVMNLKGNARYHREALAAILQAIGSLDLPGSQRWMLKARASWRLALHLGNLGVRRKRALFDPSAFPVGRTEPDGR